MATERSAPQKPRRGPGEDNHRAVGAPPAPRKQTQPELFIYGDQLGGLQRALQLDQDIKVATGILMQRHRCTHKRALELLVAAARRHHVPLADIVTDVARTGILDLTKPSPKTGP